MTQAIDREDMRPPGRGWGMRLPPFRSLVAQVLIAGAVIAVIWFLVHNTMENLNARGVTTGFAFLWRPTSLPIVDTWLAYTAGVSTYGRAILIGLLNTLTVSFIVIVLSTMLGTFIGIARMILDPADPQNAAYALASSQATAGRSVFVQYAEGDDVTPNSVTEKLLTAANRHPEHPVAATKFTFADSQQHPRADRHGFLLGTTRDAAVTQAAQSQVINFFATGAVPSATTEF